LGEERTQIAVKERLDALYRERPSAFVAGRDRLSKDLRDASDREEANRIKALRRPSLAAWLINSAALSDPEVLAEFAEASRRLGEVQGRALEGRDDAMTEWRDAAAREREASRAVVEAGLGLARDAGEKVSPKALESAGTRCRRRPEMRSCATASCTEGSSAMCPRPHSGFPRLSLPAARITVRRSAAGRTWLDARSSACDRSSTTPPAGSSACARASNGPPRHCARRRPGCPRPGAKARPSNGD
jgi:hypothetical protein